MKKRRIRAKLHNAFLWGTTYLAFIAFLVSLAISDSCIAGVVAIVSLMWMLLVALANADRW